MIFNLEISTTIIKTLTLPETGSYAFLKLVVVSSNSWRISSERSDDLTILIFKKEIETGLRFEKRKAFFCNS